MVRGLSIVVFVGAAGCDLVLGTDYFDPTTALCGPYGVAAPVVFDPQLGNPTDFSVAADGMYGLVTATYKSFTGPHPIIWDPGSGTWLPDDARSANFLLAKTLTGGHMGVGGDVFGWIDRSHNAGISALLHYTFAATWSATIPPIADSSALELTTGNEVESDAGSMMKTRYVVELAQDAGGTLPRRLEVLAAAPPATEVFLASGFVDPINHDDTVAPTGAALTGDHGALVYSARVDGAPDSHLFVSKFSKFQFSPGDPIDSLAVTGKSDDQPWINPDCSQIWFRRDGVTMTAQKR